MTYDLEAFDSEQLDWDIEQSELEVTAEASRTSSGCIHPYGNGGICGVCGETVEH